MPDKQVTYVLNLRDKFSTRLGGANKNARRFDKSMGSLIGRFATFAAVGGVLVNSVKKIADFEEAVSNLSAITGATGEDLDFLSSKAIELGKATTKSSIDTVNAFKLIASAKPELLDNAQALAATTKEAIVLSEASGLTLPDAARALASALNQFNLSADQSSRAINVLAAGSKFAGAEIPDLTMSLKEFGGIAESLGVPLEQAAAAVETISSKELKGSRAGIQLKNVFLRLGKSADKNLNPKIVGLSKALENLAPIQDDVTALTKLFGTENILAGQTLIKQRDRLDELTKAMTGTSIAYEQASINTDNLNSDVKRLSSAWEGFVLNLNQGEGQLTGLFRGVIKGATEFIDLLDTANQTFAEIRKRVREESLTESTREDVKEFESFINTIGIQKENIEELTAASERFLQVDKDRLAQMLESGTFDRKQIALLKNRISAIRGFINAQKDVETTITGRELAGGETVTKITAGAPKVFNITIQQMTGIENLNTKTFEQGIEAAGNSVLEEMSIALADLQAVAQ